MKIELDIDAITIGPGEKLLLVLPLSAAADYPDGMTDPLLNELKLFGIGDQVFIIYADDVQIAKFKT